MEMRITADRPASRALAEARSSALQVDETELLRRLQAQDDLAFEELVRRHADRMLAVARRLLRSEEDARDAVQDAFLSAFRDIGRFRQGSKLGTWLHRITVNAALMRMRSRRCRPEVELETLLPVFDETGHHARPVPVLPPLAEDRLLRAEQRRRVRSCIDRLPETHRTVLLLRDIEEMDTGTVAEILGISCNAVKIRLHRARMALAALMAREV